MKFIDQITNKGIIVGLHKGLVTPFPKERRRKKKKKKHFYHHRADFCHGSYNNTMNYLKPKRSLVCLLWARGNGGKSALSMGTGQPRFDPACLLRDATACPSTALWTPLGEHWHPQQLHLHRCCPFSNHHLPVLCRGPVKRNWYFHVLVHWKARLSNAILLRYSVWEKPFSF